MPKMPPETISDIIAEGLARSKQDTIQREVDEMKRVYRHNTINLEQQRANDTQYGGDHYKKMQVQPWDIVDEWPLEQQVGYHRGGALKYIMRMGTKDERLQEAKKAMHYIQKLVEILERAEKK